MVRLIVSIVLLIILSVFVVLNADFKTGINLFGYKIESIATIAVVLMGMVAGVIYSFGLYMMNYMVKSRRIKLRNKSQASQVKEKELKQKEKDLDKIEDTFTKEKPAEPDIIETVESESTQEKDAPPKNKPKSRLKFRKKK